MALYGLPVGVPYVHLVNQVCCLAQWKTISIAEFEVPCLVFCKVLLDEI